MRPARYRFPDDVRTATRTMASRMKDEGAVPETPEQLDDWISRNPDVRERLVAGGYGTAFSAGDLLPLLHVFAGKPEPAAAVAARAPWSRSRWVMAVALVVVVAVVVIILAGATWLRG